MDWITKIQNKPHHVKVKLLFIVLVSVAVLLVALWFLLHKDLSGLPRETILIDTLERSFKDLKNNWK